MFVNEWFRWMKRSVQAMQQNTAGKGSRRHPRQTRLALEILENRVTPSAYTVNVLGDASGVNTGTSTGTFSGDLRYCLNAADSDAQADTITFDAGVFGSAQIISLSAALSSDPTSGIQNVYGPTAFVLGSAGNITITGSVFP